MVGDTMDEETKKEIMEIKAKMTLSDKKIERLTQLLIDEGIVSRTDLEED